MARAAQLRDRLVYEPVFGRAVLMPAARVGMRQFDRTGRTPRLAYAAMRKIYGNRDERLFEQLQAHAVSPDRSDAPRPAAGLAAAELDVAVEALRRDGCVTLTARVDDETCDELEAVARAAKCVVIGTTGVLGERLHFNQAAPAGVRYDVDENDIVVSPAAQRLICDESLLAIAWRYLGAEPVQDLVAMWWSAAVGGEASSLAAQQFHFDLDRLRFMKVFVLLTDVDDATGPHVYVKGTHRSAPEAFRHDGRHSDERVETAFESAVTTIKGTRGTIFLADTRGLHKGLRLRTGHRLMFQTEYATSLFGAPYSRPLLDSPGPEFQAMREKYPRVFARFRSSTVAPAV